MSELQVIIILTVYVLRVLSQVCLSKEKESQVCHFGRERESLCLNLKLPMLHSKGGLH